MTICDGTFATPALQRPLECGIGLVTHSTTKHIGGHSDVIGGALITLHPNYLFERARLAQTCGGGAPSPFDWRRTPWGIGALPDRGRAQAENAMRVARSLQRHPAVEAEHYPGLEEHPGHQVAARQMAPFGRMLSFRVRGGQENAMDVAARCRLFIRATSLGGTHSLIEHRAPVEGPGAKVPQNPPRLSIGLEHASEPIEELAQALEGVERP